MKWLTTILAIYLVGLSLWPCADEALSVIGQGDQAMLTIARSASSEDCQDHHDHCTPLCSCACCAATIIIVTHICYAPVHLIEFVPATATSFLYTLLHWADPLSAIWQPPKLAV